jgi:eukaryotic-like serine/threonine-protein kinase
MARSGPEGDGGTRFGDGLMGEGVGAAERFKPELAAGSVIDEKYRLEHLLGEGGMGAVWCAHHLQLDLPVAIKLLRADTESVTLSERLKIEARAAAQLVHPAIVRVFDVDTTDGGDPFIVMELLNGENLSDLLDRGRLSGASAVQIMLPIAEALALAHGKGIVHRDLKPHNVFMAEEGERLQPKLLDFGIAKLVSAPTVSGGLTETGIPIGSPDYMSPEQARGIKDVDYRADIWSFSVVLYEAVTGDVPFRCDNYNALMRAIVENDPAPILINENLDQDLAELILWGLAKDRNDRPGSIQELGRELARWLIDRGVKEDVCGSPLGPRWITRTAQKSVPIIQLDDTEKSQAPEPMKADTLVSARLLPTRAKPAASVAQPEPSERAQPARRKLVWGAAALLLVCGLLWAFTTEPRISAAPEPRPSASNTSPAPASLPSRSLEPVEIAPTPAAPLTAAAPLAPPSASGNSVPAAASSSGVSRQPRDGRSRGETTKPAPAAQPARDGHDETRELLQAY